MAYLSICRAGDADADGARGAVAGETDHADVVAEVLATELRTDACKVIGWHNGVDIMLVLQDNRQSSEPHGWQRAGACVFYVMTADRVRRAALSFVQKTKQQAARRTEGCCPVPMSWVSLRIFCSHSRSRKARPPGLPLVWSVS